MPRHDWPEQGLQLKYFDRSEFDHPDKMDRMFLRTIDRWRERVGLPIRVTSDYRTEAENEQIGGNPNSPHLRGLAIDCEPVPETSANRMKLIWAALDLWVEDRWPGLGLGVYDEHLHADMDTELRRPHLWVGTSK